MSTPPQPQAPPPFLVRFYDPTLHHSSTNSLTLRTILAYPNTTLESSHTYIQLLFPLPEPSPINPSAPLIDQETFTHFRSNPALRAELRRAFERMLGFYGLKAISSSPPSTTTTIPTTDTGTYTIAPVSATSIQDSKARNWATSPFTHNHLRITRIIRSLRVLGCGVEAAAFYAALMRVAATTPQGGTGLGRRRGGIGGRVSGSGSGISERSLGFWRRAAVEKLNVPPEDERGDVGQGEVWLRGLM